MGVRYQYHKGLEDGGLGGWGWGVFRMGCLGYRKGMRLGAGGVFGFFLVP